MNLQQLVSITPDVLMQELSGESVLLDLNSEQYFGLDEVGTRIWRLIEENGLLQTVFEQLLDEYEVEPDRLEKDLFELVDRLAEAGLVTMKTENDQAS